MVNFDLGQFNATKTMDEDPAFDSQVTSAIGAFDVTCAVDWTAAADKGWHKVFRYKVDADDLDDTASTDILYFTDKTAWMTETGHGGVNLMTGVNTNDASSSNDKSGNADESIAKDFLRHMANEVMGGASAGASKGASDIFSNEEDLLTDIEGLHSQFQTAHQTTLNTSGADASTANTTKNADNIGHVILTQLLSNDAGIARVATKLNARSAKTDEVELLEVNDTITFVLTVQPKGGDGASPLGANTISEQRYKVVVTLKSA